VGDGAPAVTLTTMISQKTLEQLKDKYQISPNTIMREYFQHVFLSYFYQQKHTDKVYFKGGTALRLIYQSLRFSEDIDFTAAHVNTAPIEDAVVETLADIAKEGIGTDIEESKPTTSGYIAILHLSAYDTTIPIRLEVSLRKEKRAGSVTAIASDYIPDYTVVQLEEAQLIGEKITALLTRKKPRDFYDFYFLLRHNMIHDKNRETFEAVQKALNETHISFDTELREFLPKSHHMIIRDFKTTLEREIKRYI
jgi:predicted nucleotidyltransferase component of viral defense system